MRNYPNEVNYLIFFAFLIASFVFFCYLCNAFPYKGYKAKSLLLNYSPKSKQMEKQFLTTKEAAAFLGYKPSYLYKLIMWRRLPYFKVGRGVRFKREDLVNFLTECRVSSFDELQGKAELSLIQKGGRL